MPRDHTNDYPNMINPQIMNLSQPQIQTCLSTLVGVILISLFGQPGTSLFAQSAENSVVIAKLTDINWAQMAPAGKEVDAILGDFVLRNNHVTGVIAQNNSTRNANMTVRQVGGCLIDLTQTKQPNDQLSCFYPGNGEFDFSNGEIRIQVDGREIEAGELAQQDFTATGDEVVLLFQSKSRQDVSMKLTYRLDKDDFGFTVVSDYSNDSDQPFARPLFDSIRADRTFRFSVDPIRGHLSAYDQWFYQAYGIVSKGQQAKRVKNRRVLWTYAQDGKDPGPLKSNSMRKIERIIIPARNEVELAGLIDQVNEGEIQSCRVIIKDASRFVQDAKVTMRSANNSDFPALIARTDPTGALDFKIRSGTYDLKVEADGRPTVNDQLIVEKGRASTKEIELESLGTVFALITDDQGRPLPCKVAFVGIEGTNNPNFGPDSRAIAVQNLRYSENGRFEQQLGPGKYEVFISRGPEYDAIVKRIEVNRGESNALTAVLKRTVNTDGWVSADFHSHSSPSGDNTSDQLGRVLNLLAEHIEFAPCTEHNRIDTYQPHLEALSATNWMATCCGIELTGGPLPVNHQNAFPLLRKPRTQDGGGPVTDVNPIVQIQRLSMWDSEREKLVQMNHPNLVTVNADVNNDGEYDGGFRQMFESVDVIEVHPPHQILVAETELPEPDTRGNVIFNWLQLLNTGRRIPGVVNTDAHYNFHGSGWLRNYIASSTDDPAQIDTMEMVRNSKQGRVLMTNGPFLKLSVAARFQDSLNKVSIGEEIKTDADSIEVDIEVQCPNWLDINRVQIFLNGRPAEKYNFTRRTHPTMFGNGVSKFNNTISIALKDDTHIIVAAAGEGLKLGRIMGPGSGENIPIAVSNPIYVDVGGDGFIPNQDRLGAPFLVSEK